MAKDKTGREYERFVAKLQKAILNSEELGEQKNIVIEKNKLIKDNNGIDREFDLYWEYELGGLTYKTVIECKDYKSPVRLEKIDALIGKIRDIPELKPVIATNSRYQSGVDKKAEKNGIELLIVREQNDSDWINELGMPLTKILNITVNSHVPARITKLDIFFDEEWVKDNRPDIDITKPFQYGGFDNEIFIDDIGNKEKYSLYDYAIKITSQEKNEPGDYERTKEFTDAYILHEKNIIKIKSIGIFFRIYEPIQSKIIIDYSKELIGVIEYLNKGVKKKIFENGEIYQDKLIQKIPKRHFKGQKKQ
jgi:hypothetical protein